MLGSGRQDRYRANCYAFFNDLHLIGDYQNGKIYKLDFDTYADDGNTVIAERITRAVHQERKRLFFPHFEIEFEAGVGLVASDEEWNPATTYASGDIVRHSPIYTGTHTGGDDASILTDSAQSWAVNELVGKVAINTTDKSMAAITANTATTVTGTLSGGTGDDWDTDDDYRITDDGEIYYECISASTNNPPPHATYWSFRLGSNPQAMLQWSDDGAHNWSIELWRNIGQIGEYKNRAIWNRLGSARDRRFKLHISDPIKRVILAAFADIEIGAN